MMMMDRRFSRESSRESKGSITLQKKIVESQRPNKTKNVPDLTDFMNDMFFGTVDDDRRSYDLTGGHSEDEEESFDDSTRSHSSKLTQEWLEEARRMVASSPSRCESPSRLVGSPRFAAVPGRLSSASILDRRDPLSRSARRHRSMEAFSGEILTKSAKHSRNKSESLVETPAEPSPASQFQGWFSNILKPPSSFNAPVPDPSSPHQSNDRSSPLLDPPALNLPPRQSSYRKSRTNGEVGSQCTILTDNYCEDAYDLLQAPGLKKLLLAGILLDTQNLNASATCSMTRDAEAAQLLLVGSTPKYRNALFDQCGRDNGAQMDHRGTESRPTPVSRHGAIPQNSDKNSNNVRNGKPNNTTKAAPAAAPTEASPDASRGKNKFFLAKWFGFGK
ncbi:hypothetical protein POTOM_050587 [Populus tomentosa]|uniref:Uncharacterized protein n=1 Tax=Populus tomentosa TaxID=118781 RepID=A0A8X8C868_POPTO|nr:hypothetical protein POTOM_050587 [Populus tomentosa]